MSLTVVVPKLWGQPIVRCRCLDFPSSTKTLSLQILTQWNGSVKTKAIYQLETKLQTCTRSDQVPCLLRYGPHTFTRPKSAAPPAKHRSTLAVRLQTVPTLDSNRPDKGDMAVLHWRRDPNWNGEGYGFDLRIISRRVCWNWIYEGQRERHRVAFQAFCLKHETRSLFVRGLPGGEGATQRSVDTSDGISQITFLIHAHQLPHINYYNLCYWFKPLAPEFSLKF